MKGRVYRDWRLGKNWYIDICFDNRRIRESTKSSNKKFAEQLLAKRLTELRENKYFDIRKRQDISFEDFAGKYLNEYSIPNKRSSSRDAISIRFLKERFAKKYLYQITPEDIEVYKNLRTKKVQQPTVNRELTCLKTIYSKAIEWGYATENPVKKVKFFNEKNRARKRYLEWPEIEKLIGTCPDRIKPIVIAALNTGMRRGELLGLEWKDVNFNGSVIAVRNTKNSEDRVIPMTAALSTTLGKLQGRVNSKFVFCDSQGKRLSKTGWFYHDFVRAVKEAEIEDFRFHDLRHTFASHLVMGGADLLTVKELLGHKSIEMTQRYSHLSRYHKALAIESIIGPKIGRVLAEMGSKGMSAGTPKADENADVLGVLDKMER